MVLRILGIGEGNKVITPAYTYTASADKNKAINSEKTKSHGNADVYRGFYYSSPVFILF